MDFDTTMLGDEDDVAVTVEYTPGWFTPGRYSGPPEDCFPDEGEDPEIVKVVRQDTKADVRDSLTREQLDRLVEQAIEHQSACDRDYPDEPDYDPDY
jgi:hypothetical protein